jgi:hypothetical protein
MCEVNYSLPKRKLENSKYSLKNNEQGSPIYVFELTFKTIDGKNITLRKMKKGTQGNLVISEDNIIYKDIEKVKVSVLNSDDIKSEIIAKINIDLNSTYTTYLTNEIYLEFFKNYNGNLECIYNIPKYI